MSEAISKLQPHRVMYVRGVDRRGAAATMNHATATGFQVSGCWSDQADFAVLVIFDSDDVFGNVFTTRYLPDYSLHGVTLDFDVAYNGAQNPTGQKYQSVPWGALSYVTSTGASGTKPLNITSRTGQVSASRTYTVNGSPVSFDRVQLIYLGNVVYDVIIGGTYNSVVVTTPTQVATELARQINATNWSAVGASVTLSATASGATFTVTASGGADGNTVQLQELHKTGTCYLTPAGASKLTGGVDPTSIHVHVDFTSLGIDSLRQAWLTFAPALTTDSGGTNPALVAFAPCEWYASFSNWTLADPNGVLPLKVAGPGSTLVSSMDQWAGFTGSGWALQVGSIYQEGFSRASAHSGDTVALLYSCQHTHDLYLGTELGSDRGIYSVNIDGTAAADLDCYINTGLIQTRRKIGSGLAAGNHTVTLSVKSTKNSASSGYNCTFDFLQAAVVSDVPDPSIGYLAVNSAWDFDTMAYQLPPARMLWLSQKQGFRGDLDFYAGVFFALKRARSGGNFHSATVSVSGAWGTGTGLGDGDAIFINVSGTSVGAAVFPADTNTTLAQRMVDAINTLFVGVRAALGSSGQFTVTTLSPINGFTLAVSKSTGATGTIVSSGDIGAGNEGTWAVDSTQALPLNRAFLDYLADLSTLMAGAGQTITVAFSQELLGAPDANTSGGAWVQRFASGDPVLTSTAFGSWGAGVVAGVSGSGPVTVQVLGHGYQTGYITHLASGTGYGAWRITVTDADHFQLTASISNSGSYTPAATDTCYAELQTAQCTFNPATVTAYLTACYAQAAGVLATSGVVPWLQFGEVGWWFFPRVASLAVGYASNAAPISVGTNAPHTLATGNRVITAGVRGNTAANGDATITVTDGTHFTETGTSGNGTYVASTGTVSGGGMAYYDAWAVSAATGALGRALANFQHQDDDPAVNSGADAAFLAGAIKTHIDAIRTAVLAAWPAAKFELLYPYDVNYPTCYYTADVPYPQGGRLNAAVNLPSAYLAKAGSGLDRIKLEALSWAATYRNFANAAAAITFAFTVGSWTAADVRYLAPWDNGGCDWAREYLYCLSEGILGINLWAADHGKDKPQVLPT